MRIDTTSNTLLLCKTTVIASAMLLVLSLPGLAEGSFIVNGDFEDPNGTFPDGWTVSGGVASQESGTVQNQVISGSESLRVSGSDGNVQQTIAMDLANFEFSFQWLRPFASVPANRTMNVHVRDGTATPFINMRVEPVSGQTELALQLFDGSWMDLDPNGAATQLILDTETAYTITITGSDFGTSSASYDLTVIGGSVNESFTDVNLYQNDPFSAGELVNTIRFNRSSSHGSATFDNVSLVPEPGTFLLASFSVLGILVLVRRE